MGTWLGISEIKPRYYSRPLEPGEAVHDCDTWYLRVSCWHRRSVVVHSVTKETSDGLEWWARVNSCLFVGCTKVEVKKPKYPYKPKVDYVPPAFEYDTGDDDEGS